MLSTVLAHGGQALAPRNLWSAWNFEPAVVLGLLLAAWAYRRGEAASSRQQPRPWRARCFLGGLVATAVALLSPLDPLSDALASAHMVQHVLLVLVAAPLLALSGPEPSLLRGMPPVVRRVAFGWRRRIRSSRAVLTGFRHPATVWLLHVGALWFWHARVPYDAAVEEDALHALEHATFIVTAFRFWRMVIGPRGAKRETEGFGILLVFTMAMQSIFLSALLTFAPSPWYAAYATTTSAWSLEPLADQQLAGVIMWVPAGLIYVSVALVLLTAWIRGSEQRL